MTYPTKSNNHRGNAKNFQRNQKAQVLIDGVWEDRTLPCGSKQVVHHALLLERLFGIGNVRIVKVD